MPKKMSEEYKKKGRRILFSVVFLVLGFILAFSYKTLGGNKDIERVTSDSFIQEEKYREDLIEQKERNKELSDEIGVKQEGIRSYERSFSTKEKAHVDLVEEAKDLRLLLGVIPAIGQGIRVTLSDAEYDPIEHNPNDYIVHESHIFKVINELRISGAQGISINGQRITASMSKIKLIAVFSKNLRHSARRWQHWPTPWAATSRTCPGTPASRSCARPAQGWTTAAPYRSLSKLRTATGRGKWTISAPSRQPC